MKSARCRQLWLGLMVPVAVASFEPVQSAFAQTITPATDSTNTIVIQNGSRILINGGALHNGV